MVLPKAGLNSFDWAFVLKKSLPSAIPESLCATLFEQPI